jgi:hypothetical protein
MPAEPGAKPAEFRGLSRSRARGPGEAGSGFPADTWRPRAPGGHRVPVTGRAFPVVMQRSAYVHAMSSPANPVFAYGVVNGRGMPRRHLVASKDLADGYLSPVLAEIARRAAVMRFITPKDGGGGADVRQLECPPWRDLATGAKELERRPDNRRRRAARQPTDGHCDAWIDQFAALTFFNCSSLTTGERRRGYQACRTSWLVLPRGVRSPPSRLAGMASRASGAPGRRKSASM